MLHIMSVTFDAHAQYTLNVDTSDIEIVWISAGRDEVSGSVL